MRLQAKDVVDYLNTNGMNCNFNPHLTGLYEAALKSSKSHLKRIIGTTNRNASRSNWSMRLIRVLSRPMSDDAEDLQALTPGHFLVGHSLWMFAEPRLLKWIPADCLGAASDSADVSNGLETVVGRVSTHFPTTTQISQIKGLTGGSMSLAFWSSVRCSSWRRWTDQSCHA